MENEQKLVPLSQASALDTAPVETVRGTLFGTHFEATTGVRHYAREIETFYGDLPKGRLEFLCQRAGIPFAFRHFGLIFRFASPVQVSLYDEERHLDPVIKDLVRRFGPVVFENAACDVSDPVDPQRNIFPHLDFHVDRGRNQPNQYSLYSRVSGDPQQNEPRGSSTLFVANIVGHLQAIQEGVVPENETGTKSLYHIFQKHGAAEKALDKVIFRHPWDEPAGTGELVVIDNRTVLHASYHRPRKGWPIGTRYLF